MGRRKVLAGKLHMEQILSPRGTRPLIRHLSARHAILSGRMMEGASPKMMSLHRSTHSSQM